MIDVYYVFPGVRSYCCIAGARGSSTSRQLKCGCHALEYKDITVRNWTFCRLLEHRLLIDNGYIHSYHLIVSYIFAYPVAANTGSLTGELLDHGIFHATYS